MSEFSIGISPGFHEKYPHSAVGVLVLGDLLPSGGNLALDSARCNTEASLRARFADKSMLRAHPVLQAYRNYYKIFDKTYPVQAQLESVIFNGRQIPAAPPAVQAMFMAELDNMLLTAGHDLASLRPPLRIDLGRPQQSYTLMNGNPQNLKEGDMCMADELGMISSVVYGPDQRTRLTSTSSAAMFVVYAPAGIPPGLIEKHFSDILEYARLFSPAAERTYLTIL